MHPSSVVSKGTATHCETIDYGRRQPDYHAGIVHGDPTTSNILVDNNQRLWMIDFGLAEMNASIEMKGVDLHLVRRAFETTHWDLQDTLLNAVLKGYTKFLGAPAKEVLERMDEIRERGRYH